MCSSDLLDVSRVYIVKHTTRTVTAEFDRPLELNQIRSVTVTTARPVMADCYVENRGTGSFIIVDAATNFTAGAGMIAEVLGDVESGDGDQAGAAARLARLARAAATEDEAIAAMREALEALLG